MDQLLSVVVPCFNEAPVLPATHERLAGVLATLGIPWEILYVDDGSRDRTMELLLAFAAGDERVKVISLSRNFGHQLAVTAGLNHAAGSAVVLIDADLQDPPEVIATMLERWQEGYDVAYGLRTQRSGESRFKRWTARLFYRLINRLSDVPIPLDVGDFRLLSRRAVDAFNAMPECDRFIRGMVAWVGFRQVAVPYARDRRHAGESKYPLRRMLRFAWDGIVSFSDAPARFATTVGFVVLAIATVVAIQVFVAYFFAHDPVPGWTSTFLAILFLGGMQSLCIGILGEYIARIYREVKRRPLYLVAATANLSAAGPSPRVPADGLAPGAPVSAGAVRSR
jgi:glycosyltransferase involved in cell wall biosynthesis